MEKLWTKNFLVLTISNLLFFFSFQMIVPILPLYVHEIAQNDLYVGVIVSAGTIGALISRPITGRLVDRGNRLPYYYIGLLAAGFFVFSYSYAGAVFFLFCLRFCHSLGMGMYSSAAMTLVTDLIPRRRLAEGISYYNVSTSLAMAIAPVVSIALLNMTSFARVFNISMSIVALVVVLSILTLRPPAWQRPPQPAEGGFFERKAIVPALLLLFQASAHGALVTFIALYGRELGIGNVGVIFTAYASALLLCRLFVGRLADRKGYGAVLVPGIILSALAFAILGLAHNLPVLIAGAALFGLGYGATFPVLSAMGVGNVMPARRGAANSTVMCGHDLGIGLGALLWGAVSYALGYSMMYWLNVPVLAISLALYFLLRSRHAKSQDNPAVDAPDAIRSDAPDATTSTP